MIQKCHGVFKVDFFQVYVVFIGMKIAEKSNEWPYMEVSPSVKHWLVDWKTFEYRGEI
jgi:hypothetical protein